MKGFVEYLTSTKFADVEQGLTRPKFDLVPASLRKP
jgi:hypothetical protein